MINLNSMRKIYIFLLIILSFIFLNGLFAQSGSYPFSGLPLNPNISPLFGKDIVIHDQPSRNQWQVTVCSAFNGWLYALYTYQKDQMLPAFTLLRSIDNGITWSVLYDGFEVATIPTHFNSVEIIAPGTSLGNLKVFAVFAFGSDEYYDYGGLELWQFNAETGNFEGGFPLRDGFGDYSVSIASDYNYPATGSNPYSVGMLYSKHDFSGNDSIIFLSSGDGGVTFNNRKAIAGTSNRFHKVALGYGRSTSKSSGRYYAVWEEKADFTSNTGHIYSAHTEPYFNSSFTSPIMLDALDPLSLNNLKNPSIACQVNNIDNDSADLTTVVLCDKYIPATNSYANEGFYNMRSAGGSHFTPFPLTSSPDNCKEPSISFNPFDLTFMTTYYDSTLKKLPFLVHNFNMANPGSWQVINSGYNDTTNLSDPMPKVALNFLMQQGACVWIRGDTAENGVAVFDAPYITYTGYSEGLVQNLDVKTFVYPNPCSRVASIDINLPAPEWVRISIHKLTGELLAVIADKSYDAGQNKLFYDVSSISCGIYCIRIQTKQNSQFLKLMILR
jgi:hypothetical protein